ncbi:tRNA/rRNA methyltransferase (SpoU) [Emticicia oligotrophica DSM 17448]|uniref:tRNA/rRNA methyltransferase (SpoU) n=1 Tax=Emticicia oligotrophica (strain DSM 17448 / CIP 109782 / MTCC 6937 / GPTSA100-15) TaxID=929562 RepID=A0ABM5N5C8_EMTOG|nr:MULTISPECIES: RNA methyltransferase [Emticicia]AFK04721.1 tRNA/rRNA methyltransferase (SpoU) [Emticicia oligotrophica DSM 17448]
MFSKQQQKYVQSLQIKKYRQEHQRFLVEGAKSVQELLNSDLEIELLLCTPKFYAENEKKLEKISVEQISQAELEKNGTLQSNDAALAVVKMRHNAPLTAEKDEFVLVLDDIRDPGNFGTILRIADWYGIKKVICSDSTVDFYNPKVIAASMGSFTRIKIYYTELSKYFERLIKKGNIEIIGTFLDSENVHHFQFPSSGYIVLGNESNGIGESVEKLITKKITIPRFGEAESLNVGIATAIVLDNFRRRE